MPRPRKSATPATLVTPAAAAAPAIPAVSTVSKSEAVRQAIAAGLQGGEEAVAWIEEKYGIKMTAQHFSAVKANDKRRTNVSNFGDALAAMETLKPLVLSHGMEKVKRMVELCS